MRRNRVAGRVAAMMMTVAMATMGMTGCGSTDKAAVAENKPSETSAAATEALVNESSKYSDTITLVWYPNESAEIFGPARDEVAKLIKQATGKDVEQKLTTDYAIAIEAISNGTAQIGCNFGAEGYIQAQKADDAVNVLFVPSGSSGTLDDARYFSYFAVKEENAEEYKSGDSYTLDNIVGKKMSFVSNSSTSGFKVPTNAILSKFGAESKWADLTVDSLIEGGKDKFFSEVLFGGSHQGSAYNLLSGKCDVAAFCDLEVAPYVSLVSGEEASTGSVYEIVKNAEAPFDTLAGVKFTVISSTPVLNGPFVYNSDTLSPEDVKAIQDLFTSDEVADNPYMFYKEDSGVTGLYKKSGEKRFVNVEDSWFDPIRNMK